MGLFAALCTAAVLLPQAPKAPPLRPPPAMQPEVVLLPSVDPVLLGGFGLGDGGIERIEHGTLRWHPDGNCITAGGVRVECRAAGVKLTFPAGRELLVAPDGHLHLRSGEVAGPFAGGLELRLGDGSLVRIVLAPSSRQRLRDVLVVDGDRVLQPWWRGEPSTRFERRSHWAGLRFCCCGDGGEIFRAIALGPLIVLDRVLVPELRLAETPRGRLVLLTTPLVTSLSVMRRQHREPDAAVRKAMTAVAAVADRSDAIFPAGAALQRAEHNRLRWLLRGGFEVQLELDGPSAPRLLLFAGASVKPMLEWTLGDQAAAFLPNPRDDQLGKRWHGNGTRLPRIAADLQAREELFERAYALRVIERLRH